MDSSIWAGSPAAIHHHYDVGNDFWQQWLDPTMSYSCALWDDKIAANDLKAAQINKHRWHLDRAGVTNGGSLLDIGSGWGALLNTYANSVPGNQRSATGLTLSREQKKYCDALSLANSEFREENWLDHVPAAPYDGIVSMGAFEHFAKLLSSHDEKMEVYTAFFSRCRSWLDRGCYLTLQTVAYGSMLSEAQNMFIANEIFPEAELPRVFEIFKAAEGLFEVTEFRNDRLQYARTCDLWLRNMQKNKATIIEIAGADTYDIYEKYIKLSLTGFLQGSILLVRLQLKAL